MANHFMKWDMWLNLCRRTRENARLIATVKDKDVCPTCFGTGIEQDPSKLDYIECYDCLTDRCGGHWGAAKHIATLWPIDKVAPPGAMARLRAKMFRKYG